MHLTGGEIVTRSLIREGVPYVVGIPGHGCLGLVDAFRRYRDKIQVLQVRHEQSAVHLADGYFRVSGQPLAVFTSIGPGAVNTAVGVATAYVDSTAVMVLTGAVHTHMLGKGVLQEIERTHWGDFPRVLAPIVKRYWQVSHVKQLPSVMSNAFNHMLGGRPGPVLIDLPMDVQSDALDIDVGLLDGISQGRKGRINAESDLIDDAVELLCKAKRPVILVGGGVNTAGAWDELREVAEVLGAAVVTTMMGKGAFPENHPLYAWHAGSKGTTCGNAVTRMADVLLAVGCRFSDQTTSSFRRGVSFAIPPTSLIHVDVDPHEIGKNYPVKLGIVGDAKLVLGRMAKRLKMLDLQRNYRETEYFRDIQELKRKWFRKLHSFQYSDKIPVTISRCLKELREVLPEDAIVVSSSGNAQAQILQEFPFYLPRTNITSGGFSTMGFTLPAALGAKLAAPNQPVIGVVGDGDFLMTIQELATAVQYQIPVIILVLNNMGWQAITDLQIATFGEEHKYATEFASKNGDFETPNFGRIAEAFGANGVRVSRPEEIKPIVQKSLNSNKPTVIEVMVNRDFPYSGGESVGWWDVPVPTYIKDRHSLYLDGKRDEQL